MTSALTEPLDSAPCGFVAFADDGTIVTANRTLAEALGWPSGSLAGRPVESLFTVATRIFHQTHFAPLVRLEGRANEIFLVLRRQDGTDLAALVNAVRRERDGHGVTECVLLFIHERRKYEDALLQARRAAEEAQARLAEQNAELRLANERLELQAVELELQQEQLQANAAEMEAQQEELQGTNELLIVQAEELARQRTAAEDANRAKSSFLAVMSHELRTPLNAIGGYVQLIELGLHGPVTDGQREALGRVARSQRHLLRLINDVLNLSRIEAGRVEYALEDVPLAVVVDTVVPMIEPQMGDKRLAWSAEVAEGLTAHADREKTQQILINLLTNAIKFTPPGGQVALRADGLPGSPRRVAVRVRDTGIGIPAARLTDVFEPFVQVDASHTRQAEGTGLGLAISRDLARGMGGDLSAESEPGRGSVFTLTLPAGATP